MKKTIMKTNIGIINLAELDLTDDSLEVFIPINNDLDNPFVSVSESLKATIEENIRKAKEEYQKEFGNPHGKKWSDAGIIMDYQSIHIVIEKKTFSYELCFDFIDAEDECIWTGFRLDVDLSEYTNELKRVIIKVLIDKFFD